jgi:hypothetical protein
VEPLFAFKNTVLQKHSTDCDENEGELISIDDEIDFFDSQTQLTPILKRSTGHKKISSHVKPSFKPSSSSQSQSQTQSQKRKCEFDDGTTPKKILKLSPLG